MKSIKFGFIGCGRISRHHADAIKALGHNISACSARPGSRNISEFTKSYQVAKPYYNWREMLKNEDLDALVVAIDWDQTEKLAEDVIASKLPCLIEKPVALSSRRLKTIIDKNRKLHNKVMIGYNRRFYDFIPVVKKALKEKELISVDLVFPEPLKRLRKLKSEKIKHHILVYSSSHWLDLLRYLMGDIKVIHIHKKRCKKSKCDVAYNGLLYSKRHKIPVHLKAHFDAPDNTSIAFSFRDAVYKLQPIEVVTVYKGIDILEASGNTRTKTYIPRVEEVFCTNQEYKPGFLKQMKCFIDSCVLEKKKNIEGCTLRDALEVTRLCESIKRGKKI